jgi:hypothetical protein
MGGRRPRRQAPRPPPPPWRPNRQSGALRHGARSGDRYCRILRRARADAPRCEGTLPRQRWGRWRGNPPWHRREQAPAPAVTAIYCPANVNYTYYIYRVITHEGMGGGQMRGGRWTCMWHGVSINPSFWRRVRKRHPPPLKTLASRASAGVSVRR